MSRPKKLTKEQKKLQAVWGGLPRRVKVGAGIWQFEFEEMDTSDGFLFGETRALNSEIALHPRQGYTQARDTVVHELLHAIHNNTILGRNKTVDKVALAEGAEGVVRSYTPYLIQVIQDNPELIAWLQRVDGE